MIQFDRVVLLDCKVSDLDVSRELRYEVQITRLIRTPGPEGKSLKFLVGFDMLGGVPNPACTFRCTFEAGYRCEAGENFESIKEHVAVAHLVPFVREFVWNVTSRMPIGALMIPPMNTHRMVEDYNARSSGSAESTPAGFTS